jgi:acetyltransferase-like isoleucine patch superfamily enzyme
MTEKTAKEFPVLLMWMAEIFVFFYEFLLYFVSFAGPVLLLYALRSSHPLILLLLVLAAWPFAAIAFCLLIVLTKRLFLPEIRPGRFFVSGQKIRPWFFGVTLSSIMLRSPFWPFITEYSLPRYLYFKGMGAKIDSSFYAGLGTIIIEPWAITVGRNAMIGLEVTISAHKRERMVLTHQPVEIGADSLVGGRSILMPGVKIGDGAMVGANSVVLAGTVIPPGEVWSGNPARKVELAR